MTIQACDRCHARKTRCDRRFPQCGACEKAKAPCIHADKLRQRNLPRGYIDSLEILIQQLRTENKALRDELAAARAALESRNYTALVASGPARDATLSSPSVSIPTQSEDMSEESPKVNPFAVEVGYLSLVAAGEMRYLGSSSGLSLANMLDTILSLQGGIEAWSVVENPSRRYSLRSVEPASLVNVGLPPLTLALSFVNAYFEHTHIAFPLIHRPSFRKIMTRIYEEPEFYDENPFEAFLLDMVLAIGSSNCNRFDDSSASSIYFARAQQKLEPITGLPDIRSLTAILLLSHHGIFSNLRDTAASIWHLLGIGARICFEIGLHLEDDSKTNSSTSKMVSFNEEMRKRCFWCLYNLDRIVSSTLGRPLAIRDDEINVSLPSHLNDDEFGPDQTALVNSQEDHISPFLHTIRIRRLYGQILDLFYNNVSERKSSLEQKLTRRRRFHDDIDAWNSDTARLFSDPFNLGTNVLSSFHSPEWYKAIYNNAILLLYRPSPYLSNSPTIPQPMYQAEDSVMLLNTTKASLEAYSDLHRNRRLNYSWITLHSIFVAGLAFVYSVNGLLRDPAHEHDLPDVLTIMEVCRKCSTLLVVICERWDAPRQSCELFDKISTAMIRDVLNSNRIPVNTRISASTNQNNHRNPQQDVRPAATVPSLQDRQQIQEPDFTAPGVSRTAPRANDVLTLGDPVQFRETLDLIDRTESQASGDHISGLSQIWPFDFSFAWDAALDNSRGPNCMADSILGI